MRERTQRKHELPINFRFQRSKKCAHGVYQALQEEIKGWAMGKENVGLVRWRKSNEREFECNEIPGHP